MIDGRGNVARRRSRYPDRNGSNRSIDFGSEGQFGLTPNAVLQQCIFPALGSHRCRMSELALSLLVWIDRLKRVSTLGTGGT